MKKVFIGWFAVCITAVSCQKNESRSNIQKSLSATSTTSITLNGIDKDAAMKMMQHFIDFRDKDTNPAPTNVWFDKTTVERIVSLLQSEGADGIRIYFVSDLNVSGPKLKNAVALVSTKPNGADPSVPSGMRHLSYYEHAANNILFSNLKGINGIVSYNNAENTAVLYKTCNTCEIENLNQGNNLHHISRKFAEQMVQHFGGHSVNTISEWFDLGLFEALANDKNADGIRIYFATKPEGSANAGTDAFVIVKTMPGSTPNIHVDDFQPGANNGNKNAKAGEIADGGQDNGEQCPYACG